MEPQADDPLEIPAAEIPPGKIIAGKYRVLELLGKGGFGTVYLVELTAGMIGQKLAMKIIREEANRDPHFREQFLNEIRVAMSLVNKYIVQIRDVGCTEEGLLYYTMDHCPGDTLAAILRRRRKLPVAAALGVAGKILRGVSAAHDAGIIHRDLKPANVLVLEGTGGKTTVRVLDFGISKALHASPDRRRRLSGTPAYIPPEQFLDRELGFHTDLYSVGVILYESLTGERPFPGRSFEEVLERLKMGPALPPETHAPEIARHPGLSALVMKAIERNPEQRFQSAQEFYQAILDVLEGISAARAAGGARSAGPTAARPAAGVSAAPASAPPPAFDAAAPQVERIRRSRQKRSWERSRQGEKAVLLTLAAAAAIGALIIFTPIRRVLWPRRAESPPAAEHQAQGALARAPAPGGSNPSPAPVPVRDPGPAPSRPSTADLEPTPEATLEAAPEATPAPASDPAPEPKPEPDPERERKTTAGKEIEVEPEPTPVPAPVPPPQPDPQPAPAAAEKKAPGGDDPLRLPPPGYAGRLLGIAAAGGEVEGLAMKIEVVPDAYRYRMALGFEELGKAGYEGVELKNKLRSLYSDHRSLKGKPLFLVTITTSPDTYYFLQENLEKHLLMRARTALTLRVLDPKPRISAVKWDIFTYPPNLPRGYIRGKVLYRVEKLEFSLTTSSLKMDSKEPVTFTLKNLLRQRPSPNPEDSINPLKRQISCVEAKSLVLGELELIFYPDQWKQPDPPEGFDELLERLESL